jgi:hypothetical protein
MDGACVPHGDATMVGADRKTNVAAEQKFGLRRAPHAGATELCGQGRLALRGLGEVAGEGQMRLNRAEVRCARWVEKFTVGDRE